MSIRNLVVAGLFVGLAGCVGDGDTGVTRSTVAADSPDAFLLFPNTQASLGAGSYDVEVGPASGAAAGTYRLLLTRDDGTTETRSGSWTTGSTATETGIVMAHAGGLKIVATPSATTRLRLRRQGDSHVLAASTGTIDLPVSRISSAAYGQAYYDAVDPTGERTTLAAWKAKNGFGAADAHVIFRDAKDLGYGRDMYALKSGNNIAVFVNNYVVALQPGSSSNYGPLNVEAAISQDSRYLIGTNAIEFTPANQDGASADGAMRITKFFTFDKNGNRVASADLDGRGVKHMPGMCWACHGGQTLPLDASGKFQAQSLRSAKFNLIDAVQLEYSPQTAYQRPQLEAGLRTINRMVHDSFAEMQSRTVATTSAHWSPEYAQALAQGRYAATPADTGLNASVSNDAFVPAGWKQDPAFPSRPVGVELLFKNVVEPHCAGCHSLQGTTAGETAAAVVVDDQPVQLSNAINFSSYEKFMSYRSRIIDYVYRRGLMPMSLRNYESFWSNSSNASSAPAVLAFFLQDPALLDGNGHVTAPGSPVARPGNNRTVKTLPLQLDGNASLFASSWRWTLKSQPLGGNASLLNAATVRPQLVTSAAVVNGNYEIELVVSNSKGSSTAVSSVITVDNTLPRAPHELTFVQDIVPILTTDLPAGPCTNCHSVAGNTGPHPGIPVFWTSDADTYSRVMARVDLRDPENSKLLTKSTSLNHGGGIRIDRTTPAGQKHYSTIVNWIREGAVCGTTGGGVVCP